MTDVNGGQGRGARIRDRRLALGMDKAPLAKLAHVDRATLDRVEEDAPNVRETTYVTVERALDEVEAELGMNDPDGDGPGSGVVRFVVRGVYGADALIVEGPVENIADLEASVDRIMRRLSQEGGT